MAYIAFTAQQFIPYRNYVTINGNREIRIQNGYYKVPDGHYTVIVHGANGQAWECEGHVRSGFKTGCLSIRLAQDNEGNIVNVQYAVYDMSSPEEFGAMTTAEKLNLSSSTATARSDSHDAPPTASSSSAHTSAYSAPDTTPVPKKKGGTGWIVFGILCIAAAFLTAEGIESIVGCGVVGAVSLLIGIKKKAS